MIYEKLRQVETAKHADAVVRKLEVNKFFLAGPYIRTEMPANHPDNSKDLSRALRYYLCTALESPHVTVYLGEDRVLREVGLQHYGDESNATIYERHHIQHHLDGVIVLPSSPGSFCEIGDWATTEVTCKKMIVIVDKTHENVINYINDGVLRLATNNGARVHYMDYNDKENIRDECLTFIRRMGEKKRVKQLYGQL